MRVGADVQVPPGHGIGCMRSGARIADGLEVIGSEPDHDFRFVCVPAGTVGDESVVGDVGAVGGSVIAVDSCQSQVRSSRSLSE